ncbi:MAG: 20S proteasome subunit A/B [Acidimicrobiia bacterium]|nr:20S proteasome subunit A/B [Acidimicrobiia bacterium]
MTYCLALALDDGLVFASDSRSNAGSDYVTTYGKTHVFALGPDRLFVVLTAGNLSTTQEIINRLRRDAESDDGRPSLHTVDHLFEAADLVGQISLDVQEHHERGLRRSGASGSATLILGGQIAGERAGIFLVYPEGNAITVSPETPYLQIGESKYGKPILDRLIRPSMALADGARLALVSLDATAKSNVTVGMPFDVSLYRHDDFALAASQRFGRDSKAYRTLNESWNRGLATTFDALADSVATDDWTLG